MLKLLNDLQTGFTSPKTFTSKTTLQRTTEIEAATYIDMAKIYTDGVTSLDLEAVDERYLLCGANNGTVAIYDLANTSGKFSYTSEMIAHLRPSPATHESSIVRVQWYPFDTGLFITSSKFWFIKIWDRERQLVVNSMTTKGSVTYHDISSVASQPRLIAVASTEPNIILFDFKSNCATHTLKGHEEGVETVKWSPISEHLLASGGRDKRILLWDIRSAKGHLKSFDKDNSESSWSTRGMATAHDTAVTSLKFTDDGLYLVSQCVNKQLTLWDVAFAKNTRVNYGELFKSYSIRFRKLPFSMDICSTSSLPVLFVPYNKDINVYNLHSGFKYKTLTGHSDIVFCCVFRSSTHELFSGGNEMNIHIWSPDKNAELDPDLSPRKKNVNRFVMKSYEDYWSDSD